MHFPSFFANLHFVTPELARSAQPFTRGQWDAMHRKHHFSAIINLRGENENAVWYRDELAACAAAACQHLDIRLSSKRLPSRESLLQLIAAFHDLPKPLLIKCSGGADRTGLSSALYLLETKGLQALPEARSHLRYFPYLHRAKPSQRWIKEFLHFFEATHNDQALGAWLEQTYSESAFASYLTAQGKGDFWRRE